MLFEKIAIKDDKIVAVLGPSITYNRQEGDELHMTVNVGYQIILDSSGTVHSSESVVVQGTEKKKERPWFWKLFETTEIRFRMDYDSEELRRAYPKINAFCGFMEELKLNVGSAE